jgi:hypothetical protein
MIKSHYYTTSAYAVPPVGAVYSVGNISSFMMMIIVEFTVTNISTAPTSFHLKIGNTTYNSTDIVTSGSLNSWIANIYGVPTGTYKFNTMKCAVDYIKNGSTVSTAYKTITRSGSLTHKINFQILNVAPDTASVGNANWGNPFVYRTTVNGTLGDYYRVNAYCILQDVDIYMLWFNGHHINTFLNLNLNRTINVWKNNSNSTITGSNNPYKGPFYGEIFSINQTNQPFWINFYIPADQTLDSFDSTNMNPSLLSYIKSSEYSISITVPLPNGNGTYTPQTFTSNVCSL